jgi:ubiquinone/menaquinone biosynthesis C-methylase UbiE
MSDYYNSIASGYNELHGQEQLTKYRIIRYELQLPPHSKVLDVGAGTGIGHQIIPNIGIDPASELIKQHPNKQSMVASAEALPFPDKSFDAVISVTALHHTDYKKALKEMLRVSKGPVAVSMLKKSAVTKKFEAFIKKQCKPLTVISEEKDIIFIHDPRKV